MHLHFDILVLVISHLKKADLLSLMQGCRSLHAALVPHLLRMRYTISRTDQLLSFCQFMLADAPGRSVYLQRFNLDMSFFWSQRVADLFRQVLQNATHLEEFALLDCACLDANPEVASAIANLTNLKTLRLQCPTPVASDMLQRIRSTITNANLACNGDFECEARRVLDATELLSLCRESIVTLCMTPPRSTKLGVQYTSLTKLELRLRFYTVASHIMHSFPNVRYLTATMVRASKECSFRGKAEDIEAARERNLEDGSMQSWPLLEHVRGDTIGLYHLALNRHIGRLDFVDGASLDVEKFTTILNDYRSEKLMVKLFVSSCGLNATELRKLVARIPDHFLCLSYVLQLRIDSGNLGDVIVSQLLVPNYQLRDSLSQTGSRAGAHVFGPISVLSPAMDTDMQWVAKVRCASGSRTYRTKGGARQLVSMLHLHRNGPLSPLGVGGYTEPARCVELAAFPCQVLSGTCKAGHEGARDVKSRTLGLL